jgi:hypothetical protein
MATEIIHSIRVKDDRDGTLLEKDEGRRVRFTIDGQIYEMDLSATNEQAFREDLKPWTTIARKVGRPDPKLKTEAVGCEEDVVPLVSDAGIKVKSSRAKSAGKSAAKVEVSAAAPRSSSPRHSNGKFRDGIREWALAQGYDIHPKYGRISKEITDHWDREHPHLVPKNDSHQESLELGPERAEHEQEVA